MVQLLALQQLMAADLRFVLAIARINNDLERIGDQAVNIAHSATRIVRHPRVKPYVDLPRMSELAEEMMRDSLDSLVRRDIELARSVLARDDQVDQLRDQIFRELLSYMMGDSSVVFPGFRADPGGQESRAHRRPRHQHRRRRDLHGCGQRRAASRGGPQSRLNFAVVAQASACGGTSEQGQNSTD